MSAEPRAMPTPAIEADAATAWDTRWIGWRLRLLVLGALLGCIGLFLLVRALAAETSIAGSWHEDGRGGVELRAADTPALAPVVGRRLTGLLVDGRVVTVDTLLLQHSPRWLVDDDARDAQRQQNEALRQASDRGLVTLQFDDGRRLSVMPAPRGVPGVGLLFWLLAALALVLYLNGMVALLARPSMPALLYTLLTWAQCTNLLLLGVESVPGLGLPLASWRCSTWLRATPDLLLAAGFVHAATAHPRRLPHAAAIAGAAWAAVALLATLLAAGRVDGAWWWLQAALVVAALLAIALLTRSHRCHPHPVALVLRRFGTAALGTLLLLTTVIAAMHLRGQSPLQVAAVGSVIWTVFVASLLLTLPMLSRAQPLLREFSLVAGISTVATSLDLLFVAVFALGPFTSLALALFLALGAYVGARQWLMNQLLGRRAVTTERMFEQLYRAAREVEAQPQRAGERLHQLLRELYEPIEIEFVATAPPASRVLAGGAALMVPMPPWAAGDARPAASLVLRYAQRGQRLFGFDDARLADRMVEQLRRAVAYDRAVEQGRREERSRIAQDLHDDIGARLLTLMYQAPTREMEDYVRHTLQDLKTLTRGLAAPSHRLGDAAAEWKSDLGQRLQVAGCTLGWSYAADRDIELGVVQWSALTRLLRELVTNVIAHAGAARVEIDIVYQQGRFRLCLCDDGCGRRPERWAPGLGLGGIRKRVRQLGGEVAWRERTPRGICCEVRLPRLDEAGCG